MKKPPKTNVFRGKTRVETFLRKENNSLYWLKVERFYLKSRMILLFLLGEPLRATAEGQLELCYRIYADALQLSLEVAEDCRIRPRAHFAGGLPEKQRYYTILAIWLTSCASRILRLNNWRKNSRGPASHKHIGFLSYNPPVLHGKTLVRLVHVV